MKGCYTVGVLSLKATKVEQSTKGNSFVGIHTNASFSDL